MEKIPTLRITDLGLQLLIEAKGRQEKIIIKDFRIGSGEEDLGYCHNASQIKLKGPKYKTNNIIMLQEGTLDDQLFLRAHFSGIELCNLDYDFYEMGIFLDSGELFALFSSKDRLSIKQGDPRSIELDFYIEAASIKNSVCLSFTDETTQHKKSHLRAEPFIRKERQQKSFDVENGSVLMPSPIITDVGISAMFRAKQKGFKLSITKMAVGSGENNSGYIPVSTQKELKNILLYTKVTGGQLVGGMQNQLHLTALLNEDQHPCLNKNYDIFEIGFYLNSGELFAICSSPNAKLATKGSYTDLYLGFDILVTGQNSETLEIDGRSTLSRPSIKDNMIYGDNVIKIHTQEEFDEIFNKGKLTEVPENQTIILSPIQSAQNMASIINQISNIEITNIFTSTQSDGVYTRCEAIKHGLENGSYIDIEENPQIDGNYKICNVTDNTFDIEKPFIEIVQLTAIGTGYKEIGDGILRIDPIDGFTDIYLPNHGLTERSKKDGCFIKMDHLNYQGLYQILQIETDSFKIDAKFEKGNMDTGASGGVGDSLNNTFNGRPAYILKNSLKIGSNTSVIGFNMNDTIVIKGDSDVNIQIIGKNDKAVMGVNLEGWSFDGRGGVNDLGGTIKGGSNGSAFLLENASNCELNCQIINHNAKVNGAWIYGTENCKNITAKHILYCETTQGCGIYGCDTSVFKVQTCLVGKKIDNETIEYNSYLAVQGELQLGSLMIGEWSIAEVDGELSFKKFGQEGLLIEIPTDNYIKENRLMKPIINIDGAGNFKDEPLHLNKICLSEKNKLESLDQGAGIVQIDKNEIDLKVIEEIYPEFLEKIKGPNDIDLRLVTHEQIILVLVEAIKDFKEKEDMNTIELARLKTNQASCMTILLDLRNKVKEFGVKN